MTSPSDAADRTLHVPHGKAPTKRDERGLTPVSYALLGSLAIKGHQTPYQLKRVTGEALGYVWSFSHAQIYAESARLTAAGLVDEEREEDSRRRRMLSITDSGSAALRGWLAEQTNSGREVRDVGMMKLFFSEVSDSETTRLMIKHHLEIHEDWLRYYQALKERRSGRSDLGNRLVTADMAILAEEAAVEFWQSLQVDDEGNVVRVRHRASTPQ